MEGQYVLAYDFGTSGVKAALVSLKGEILASTTASYSMITPRFGWAEQDPCEYWQAIIESTRGVLSKSGIVKEQVSALAFSTQAMGIIPVDKNGTVLYNNISWVDGRAGEQAKKINELIGAEAVGGKDVICKLLWLKEELPDIFNNAKYFMDVNCYLRYKATGEVKTELTGASSYGLDLEKRFWLEELFNAVGIGIDKFPPLVKSTDLVGGLSQRAAEELNLMEGTPVYGGCDDVQAAALGAGTMDEGEGHIYLGSSAWLCVTTERILEMEHGAATVKSADPNKNVIIGVTQSAGMTVDWAIEKFYKSELGDLESNVFDCIEEEVRGITSGSGNMIVTPWLFGEYCPITSEAVRMTMFNITNLHTRAHILKAIYEGIGYNLRWIKENYEQDFGVKLSSLRVIGGGALSDHWMQALADVMQVKIQITSDVRYSGAIGAAICALVGMGVYENFNCVKEILMVKKEFLPQLSNKEIYDKLFLEYKGLYDSLKKSYERINDIK